MDFPLLHGAKYVTIGAVAGSSSGTSISTGGSAHTKGSWTQITSALPSGITGFWLIMQGGVGGAATRWMLDLAIGPSGSEKIIISNLWWAFRSQAGGIKLWIPMALPAGQRLAARTQSSSSTTQSVAVSIIAALGNLVFPSALGKATTYGATPATTTATEIDPGGTADTKGAYTAITTSTTSNTRALFVAAALPTSVSGTPTYTPGNTRWLLDVAIGAAGSEIPIISDVGLYVETSSDFQNGPHIFGPFDVSIPAGTRLSARCQSDNVDAVYRKLDVELIALS